MKRAICGVAHCQLDEVNDELCLCMDLILCKIMYKLELHNYPPFDTKIVAQVHD